jgi:LL-diaminopimelate aminotransferase
VSLDSREIFVSEGSHAALGALHTLFDPHHSVALPDPFYPIFEEAPLLDGRRELTYLPCTEQNRFIPALPEKPVDLIYLCFPNNPTGAVATREELKVFVDYATEPTHRPFRPQP